MYDLFGDRRLRRHSDVVFDYERTFGSEQKKMLSIVSAYQNQPLPPVDR
jgi:hypothetical protein